MLNKYISTSVAFDWGCRSSCSYQNTMWTDLLINWALDYCKMVIINYCFYSKLLFLKQPFRRLLAVSFYIPRKVTKFHELVLWKEKQFYSILGVKMLSMLFFFVRPRTARIPSDRRKAKPEWSSRKPHYLAPVRDFPAIIFYVTN